MTAAAAATAAALAEMPRPPRVDRLDLLTGKSSRRSTWFGLPHLRASTPSSIARRLLRRTAFDVALVRKRVVTASGPVLFISVSSMPRS